ncbi:MAG: tRNA (N6-isopentenyl adenosine(37)-C2)-methylthiotransferase MiaB [candidate division WOR-3 bacterium]
MVRSFLIQTYGCQMNDYEAGVVRTILECRGYEETFDEVQADVLLMMTCSVRERAEKRALARLAQFRSVRSQRRMRGGKQPPVIGVLGCMAQNLKERLSSDYGADIVVGPDQYRQLPELIEKAAAGVRGLVATAQTNECYETILPKPESSVCATITVMRGCDNFCSYCIVPYVKGKERSRPAQDVVTAVRMLAEQGIRDVTLLGQNVLAYRDGGVDFPALLRLVAALPDIQRVRFLTSHPRDLDERLLATIRELPKVCPSLHLPLQSGSDRILDLMNRGYTRADYLNKIALIRKNLPEATITTDILVGFPSERAEDFQATLEVVEKVRFDFAYMFRFSARPGTKAATLPEQVPAPIAAERLNRLIEIQNRITRARNREMVGRTFELLIEAEGPRRNGFLGRTTTNKVVLLTGPAELGELAMTKVTHLRGWTPIAEKVANQSLLVGRTMATSGYEN